MALILTYLGKGGCGSTTLSIATAKRLAQNGRRVLLCIQDSSPGPSILFGQALPVEPAELSSNLWVMQVHTAALLEQSWEEIKGLEAQYLRTPLLKNVYGQELGVLPGMDGALALNALRQFDASGRYDVIVFDGHSAMDTLRMFGLPEILDWYVRRFRGVFQQSDLGKALAPFIQPVASAVLSVDWQGDILDRPTGEMRSVLEQGREAVSNPQRVMGLLATTPAADAIATARYLWGSAQQIGLTIGGVMVSQGDLKAEQEGSFAPLGHRAIPSLNAGDWDSLTAALPDIEQFSATAPRATVVDVAAKTVKLFLPSFDKSQVKLTQYGPEVTIEAGDQRRNLLLPPQLQGRAVAGAKFQDQYLVVSFS
jgi:arsenite-transporting ATPase